MTGTPAARRTLTLFRHGKSSWDDPGRRDHDRPLAPRGRKAVPRISRWIQAHLPPVDVICVSDARRTRQTLARAEEAGLEAREPPQVLSELYLASASRLMKIVRGFPDGAGHAVLIGHNPGLHELALSLVGSGDDEAVADLALNLPTAALAVLTFQVESWRAVQPGDATLSHFVAPRKLKAGDR
ncbi:MAG: histidine phosphatase family protein [Pseudomonadota bacterium]